MGLDGNMQPYSRVDGLYRGGWLLQAYAFRRQLFVATDVIDRCGECECGCAQRVSIIAKGMGMHAYR
jgi:hypothetical protein